MSLGPQIERQVTLKAAANRKFNLNQLKLIFHNRYELGAQWQ